MKSNVAYYYAAHDRKEMAKVALDYAKLGLETGERVLDMAWIENFLFVFKKFGLTKEAKKEWIRVFENYTEQVKDYLAKTGFEEDFIDYERYYNKIKGFV